VTSPPRAGAIFARANPDDSVISLKACSIIIPVTTQEFLLADRYPLTAAGFNQRDVSGTKRAFSGR